MKMLKNLFFIAALLGMVSGLSSCNNDEHYVYFTPAVVTVIPTADEGFVMQLNDSITLFPINLKKAPYGNREVRAQILYEIESGSYESGRLDVALFRIDSIRTKLPVADAGAENDKLYGNDPLDIVKDWRTVAEDGYLTLRIRMRRGTENRMHYVNLIAGVNPDNPYEFDLRHHANGDSGIESDALIAFNLNELLKDDKNVKLKINWKSFAGPKSIEFDLKSRGNLPIGTTPDATDFYKQVQ